MSSRYIRRGPPDRARSRERRDLELDVLDAGHRQQVGDPRASAGEPLVLVERQQHVRRPAAIRDDHRPGLGRLLGLAGVLVELAA